MSLSNLRGKREREGRREKGDWKAEMLQRGSGMAAERGNKVGRKDWDGEVGWAVRSFREGSVFDLSSDLRKTARGIRPRG